MGWQPAVDDAVVEVARVLGGPTDGVLARKNITDVALLAVGVRHTTTTIIMLLADLVPVGVRAPGLGDTEEVGHRHAGCWMMSGAEEAEKVLSKFAC